MTVTKLGTIGELVGGAAVIGSLVFVGMRIRQTVRSVRYAANRRWAIERGSPAESVSPAPWKLWGL